jgi:hypothetical protein
MSTRQATAFDKPSAGGTQSGPTGSPGYALVSAVILAVAIAIVAAAFLKLSGQETRATQSDLDSQRAFWLAEAGRARALRYLTHLTRPPETELTIYQDLPGPDGGTYTVTCLADTAAHYQVEKAFVLDCVGHFRQRERRIRQRIRMTSFAQYSYFTDNEQAPGGSAIWFFSTDVIEGRLHTNGTLHIAGSPQFLDLVTSASDHMLGYPSDWINDPSDWPSGGNNPHFAHGFELNTPQIPLPTQTLDLRQEAIAGGLYLAPESELELGVMGTPNPIVAPGWLRCRNLPPPNGAWTSVRIASLANKVVYCNGNLHIKGVLDGELTVASGRDVRIEDNVTYLASNAQGVPLPGCDDLLGIVAGNNVVFVNNLPNQDNLIIDGVLMALNTSVTAENYGTPPPRGTLTIHGGLIQKYRGAVGTFSGTTLLSGYRKDYHYDQRVTARTPPAFPLTGVYEEVAWSETWDDAYPF